MMNNFEFDGESRNASWTHYDYTIDNLEEFTIKLVDIVFILGINLNNIIN